jgi:hypothetical protein
MSMKVLVSSLSADLKYELSSGSLHCNVGGGPGATDVMTVVNSPKLPVSMRARRHNGVPLLTIDE